MEVIPEGNEYVLQQTIGFQRVIQRAVNHVRSAEKSEVSVSDILASIFMEKDSHAAFFSTRRASRAWTCSITSARTAIGPLAGRPTWEFGKTDAKPKGRRKNPAPGEPTRWT
jgi:ATP-dependent Clp protease ATP-binding subunit ClpA